MNLVSPLKWMAFLTVTALLYTHMQMQIFDLAYKAKIKEKFVHQLKDDNGILTHQILTLKSANNLGEKLLDKNDGLMFMGHDRVLTIKQSGSARKPQAPVVVDQAAPKPGIFSNVLSLLSPREASARDY